MKWDIKRDIKAVAILVYIGFGLIIFGKVITSNQWNSIIITISIGLLTFLSIFHPLVIKKELLEIREDYLLKKWSERSDLFYRNIDSLKKETDYKKMYNIGVKLQSDLEFMTNLEKETDINKNLNLAIVLFISSLFLFLTDTITSLQYVDKGGMIFTLRWIAIILFLVGFYRTIQIINTWYILSSEKIEIKK